MNWHCPNCNASCRTPESLSIHVSHCRAMSMDELESIFDEHDELLDDDKWEFGLPKRKYPEIIKAIHAFHIKKLRGRKNL